MGKEIKFEGLYELEKAMKKKLNMDAVKQVVKFNGGEMQNKAQRKVPVDTGTLKRSIALELSDSGLTATVEPTAEYSAYVELGTRFMNAQPYLEPALNEQKQQFKKHMDKLVK